MPHRKNTYRCAVEVTQTGKFCVRIQAFFGRSGWTLPAFFLASSPSGAFRRLRQAIGEMQRSEERLQFWAVERSDDPELAAELLAEIGLALDHRNEFPANAPTMAVVADEAVPAAQFAELKRRLAPQFAPMVAA